MMILTTPMCLADNSVSENHAFIATSIARNQLWKKRLQKVHGFIVCDNFLFKIKKYNPTTFKLDFFAIGKLVRVI